MPMPCCVWLFFPTISCIHNPHLPFVETENHRKVTNPVEITPIFVSRFLGWNFHSWCILLKSNLETIFDSQSPYWTRWSCHRISINPQLDWAPKKASYWTRNRCHRFSAHLDFTLECECEPGMADSCGQIFNTMSTFHFIHTKVNRRSLLITTVLTSHHSNEMTKSNTKRNIEHWNVRSTAVYLQYEPFE